MVKLKFIIRDNSLVLRISEGKQRFYKSVNHLLTGNPVLEKHWNSDKQRFSRYTVSYADNNKSLEDFKSIYNKLIIEHPELNAKQVAIYYNAVKQDAISIDPPQTVQQAEVYCNSVEKFMEVVIQREKAKQGCNFESYDKLLKKCRKILTGFSSLTFKSLNYDSCVGIANIFAQHKGYKNTSASFRCLLGKAHKDNDVQFRLSQIGDFKFVDYSPNKYDVCLKKPDVLSPEQLKLFLNMNINEITPSYNDREMVELYYNFSVFMFHSFFAPCDAIKLKYSNITKDNTLVIKRKKTHRQLETPISPVMKSIINKYRGTTKNDYVFPILDDEKAKKYKIKDHLFKKFNTKLNTWLKSVEKELKLDCRLYAYVFRHTAITVALDNGLPVSYVSLVAGTSIEMIQEHYYNGDNPMNHKRLQMAFMKAAT